MSLPTYLASIKSSGIYRFVWDKSQVPPQTAETMRLVVGYSEKGPFNTPTYCENTSDFIAAYGNISKRLERKGCFFHRSALAALGAGPILALNLKPFKDEQVGTANFNFSTGVPSLIENSDVINIYDTSKFWSLDADTLPKDDSDNYVTLTATDSKETSCSVFMRGIKPAQYDITIREWYANSSEEMPEYLEPIQDKKLSDYFVDMYVFRGEFTEDICKVGAPFGNSAADKQDGYFVVNGTGENAVIKINADYKDAFGQIADALNALANDPSSQYLGHYTGCTLPYFKDGNGNYISIDILVNGDYLTHKLLMKLDESKLESFDIPENGSADKELDKMLKFADDLTIKSNVDTDGNFNGTYTYPSIAPAYFNGYDYQTIEKGDKGLELQDKVFEVFDYIGIRKALTSHVDVEYHYIVDTFATYAGSRNKSKIALIAKEKDNAFALLNYPFISEYKSGGDKYMIDKDGKKYLDFSKVVAIDNILPSKANGASWCAFFTGVVISDGTLKSTCPTCGYISNLFMEKWGPRHPYDAVAGPNFGVISEDGLVGPDYAFSRADLDVLEPYGVNCLVYRPRIGTYINSNQTAQQVPVTALSKINVRELVIYLQNEIETMLQGYHWELNTQALRDTIKAKADSILENVQQNGGVYAFKNVCDETNNTPEVIDNEMLILSTEIEAAKSAGKMVQELTIHRTGGLTSVSTNS